MNHKNRRHNEGYVFPEQLFKFAAIPHTITIDKEGRMERSCLFPNSLTR